jgi:hypothetical protein
MSAADTRYSRTSEKCSRRNFLSGAALAGAAALAGESGSAFASTVDSGRPFKVCVFADLHYFPGVMTNSEDTSFLESIMARAEREKCEWLFGVSPEKAGLRQYDGDARRYTCEIKSADLTLNFG